MTIEIAIVLGILAAAVALFVSGRVRVDLVALLVVTILAVSGILTPQQALAGFSSPAVLIVASMFVVSAAMARTGVASLLGQQLLRAGDGEARQVGVVMLTAATLSSVMNNLGVIALLLPVTMEVARKTGVPPSRLLLPLILGAHLGGMTTLIGTPPNIIVSDVLRDQGYEPLTIFSFAPIGIAAVLLGTLFTVVLGRHLLPRRDPARDEDDDRGAIREVVALEERLFYVRLPRFSRLDGRTLGESRIGSALGLHVLAIERNGSRELSPDPGTILHAEDRLLVQGRPDLLRELGRDRHLVLEEDRETRARLVTAGIGVAEARVAEGSELDGSTLNQVDFRRRFGVIVLAYRRGDRIVRSDLQDIPLQEGDVLLVQGPKERLLAMDSDRAFDRAEPIEVEEVLATYQLDQRFLTFRVTPRSLLVGRSLAESKLGDAAGITVLGILRDGSTMLIPAPEERFREHDILLTKTKEEHLEVLRGLQRLEVEDDRRPSVAELESPGVGLAEAVVAPLSGLAGSTLRESHFRDRIGLDVLAVWRAGRAYRSNLRDMKLELGDALLLFGPRERLELLRRDQDFIVLSGLGKAPPDTRRAPLSAGILLVAVIATLVGLVEVEVALLAASVAMVVTRCLPLDEAYRSIEWKALILIGGMLALGTALGATEADLLLGAMLADSVGGAGPHLALAALCLATVAGVQVMPPAAVAVLMAPIGITTALAVGLSPQAAVIGIALASAALASPVAHPGNVLVMASGGYRYADYLKVGLPVTLVVGVLVVLFAPLLFPA